MLVPSINIYGGKCAEAMELYQKAFGAKVSHVSYSREAPDFVKSEADDGNSVMHASVTICGSRVDMFDNDEETPILGNTLCLNAYLDTDDEVCRAFDILKEGATIEEEPKPEFWSSMYARLIDRFGIMWHLMVK